MTSGGFGHRLGVIEVECESDRGFDVGGPKKSVGRLPTWSHVPKPLLVPVPSTPSVVEALTERRRSKCKSGGTLRTRLAIYEINAQSTGKLHERRETTCRSGALRGTSTYLRTGVPPRLTLGMRPQRLPCLVQPDRGSQARATISRVLWRRYATRPVRAVGDLRSLPAPPASL